MEIKRKPKSEELSGEEKIKLGQEVDRLLNDPSQVNRISIGLRKEKGTEHSE